MTKGWPQTVRRCEGEGCDRKPLPEQTLCNECGKRKRAEARRVQRERAKHDVEQLNEILDNGGDARAFIEGLFGGDLGGQISKAAKDELERQKKLGYSRSLAAKSLGASQGARGPGRAFDGSTSMRSALA